MQLIRHYEPHVLTLVGSPVRDCFVQFRICSCKYAVFAQDFPRLDARAEAETIKSSHESLQILRDISPGGDAYLNEVHFQSLILYTFPLANKESRRFLFREIGNRCFGVIIMKDF